jgi:glycosyltransferase involved in cell wall biosynthesis
VTGPDSRSGDAGSEPERARPPGVRVVLDARPLQEAERAPATAAYLDALLDAFDRTPLPGESFVFLLQSDLDDPTARFTRLEVIGRRLLPPTRLLRSGALTVDPILLRGASLGAAWRAERGGAAGSVYHAAGGAVPLASHIPLVATLLDLAPWHLPAAYQRGVAARFGQRLRAGILRDAAAVLVGSEAIARDARLLLRLHRERVLVVPFAPRTAFASSGPGPGGMVARSTARNSDGPARDARAERERLGLGERYFVYAGRYDARQDLPTLLRALAFLSGGGRPPGLDADVPWPPRVLLVGATPGDRASLARLAAREGVGDSLAYAPRLEPERLASLVRAARAALLPVVSEAAGFAALDALAAGTPVVASSVGALPELVGPAGILVDPRRPERLAEALRTAWLNDAVHGRLAAAARERAGSLPSWDDVALATRVVYATVATRGGWTSRRPSSDSPG